MIGNPKYAKLSKDIFGSWILDLGFPEFEIEQI
jgi:hypothetical protein